MKARFDCSKCPGYCCSYARISVSDHDIARLARHFGVDIATARRRYTYHYTAGGADEWILRHRMDSVFTSMCRFFDQDSRRVNIVPAAAEAAS